MCAERAWAEWPRNKSRGFFQMGKPYGYMIVVIVFCMLEMMDIGILEF